MISKNMNCKPQEFAELTGVSVETLQRWDREGVLVASRTPTNRRYYTYEHYLAFKGLEPTEVKKNTSPFVGRPTKRPPVDELLELYQTMPVSEIAKIYGVKRSTVSSWMTRLRQTGQVPEFVKQIGK